MSDRQRGDLVTGEWRKDVPLPRCAGCGEVIESMWAIPAHVRHGNFDIVYPEPSESTTSQEGVGEK